MSIPQTDKMFDGVPHDLFRVHDWRNDVVTLGTVAKEFVGEVTEGKYSHDYPVQINKLVRDGGHDLVISIGQARAARPPPPLRSSPCVRWVIDTVCGQVVPHEVAGMANHTKNILVRTHRRWSAARSAPSAALDAHALQTAGRHRRQGSYRPEPLRGRRVRDGEHHGPMCARAHPPVDCRPRRRITQRGVLPADDNPVRKLYNKAWADFASHLPMCWMQTVCAKDAATNVRPPALRALVCIALGSGAPRACGTALSAARPVPTAEAGGAWILHGWRVCSVCRGGEAGCEGERERPPAVLDSYGLTPKSPQTNFEMMDEEVRCPSAAALPWQAPRFSPMLTCAPPAAVHQVRCVSRPGGVQNDMVRNASSRHALLLRRSSRCQTGSATRRSIGRA